jgi:hypothetical protein
VKPHLIFTFLIINIFKSYSIDRISLFKQINRQDGLPSNCVYDIFQDKTGYLWFSTNNGVVRFDSHHYDIFTSQNGLLDNDVFFSREDSKGRVWMLTSNSKISIYHRGNLLNQNNFPPLAKIKSTDWFTSFLEDKEGNIWLSCFSTKVIKIDNNFNVEYFNVTDRNNFTSDLFLDDDGNLSIFSNIGLHTLQNNSFTLSKSIETPKGLAMKFFKLPNKKYLYSTKGRLEILDKNLKSIGLVKTKTNLGLINKITTQNNSLIYLSDDNNIYILNSKNQNIRQYSNIQNISSLSIIEKNIVLISTLDKGIKISIDDKILGIKQLFNGYKEVFSIYSKENVLYFGGKFGEFSILKNDKLKQINSLKNLYNFGMGRINYIQNIFDSMLAISFDQRFVVYMNEKIKYIFPYNAKSHIETKNDLYIATGRDVVKLPKSRISNFTTKFKEINNKLYLDTKEIDISLYSLCPWLRTSQLYNDSSEFYICSNKGLLQINSNNIDSSLFKISKTLKYPIKNIHKITFNKFIISIPGFGISIYDRKTINPIKDNQIFPFFSVSKFLNYDPNSIWICSNNGLYKISFNSDFSDFDLLRFTINDGLLSNEVNDITYSQGKWWVATSGGVTVFDEAYFKTKNETPPKVVFRELLLNGSTTISDERPLVEGNTRIKFSVGCLSFKHFRNIRFRYKLHPRDYWRYSMDFDHELANLSRGKYQIQIQARSPFSPWSRSIMLPAFTILPPFWERWWVQYPLFGGGALLFGLLVFTGYRIRLNRIRMRNQLIDANLTALRAQIRPHFIANIINSVQIYFLNNKKEDAIVFLGTFGKMVRRILDTSEEEFITVSEELKQIREYLDFECRRTSRKIDYEIRFPDDMNINYIYLPTMLLQPILENAMIHGLQVGEITEGSVEIQFLFIQEKGQKLKKNEFNISLEGRMLVSISDTGIGRAASSIKKHSSSRSFGVKSIQNRLKWISEKFDCEAFAIVEDLKNKYEEPAGTMVTLNLPLFIKDPFASID